MQQSYKYLSTKSQWHMPTKFPTEFNADDIVGFLIKQGFKEINDPDFGSYPDYIAYYKQENINYRFYI